MLVVAIVSIEKLGLDESELVIQGKRWQIGALSF